MEERVKAAGPIMIVISWKEHKTGSRKQKEKMASVSKGLAFSDNKVAIEVDDNFKNILKSPQNRR
jgi:hypothetical protein